MPSSATITSFYSFAARTVIASSEMNTNFSVFRGHILPVTTDTATASNNTYDLGSSEYAWRMIYCNGITFGTAASALTNWNKYSVSYTNLQGATATNFFELFSSPAMGTIERIVVRQTAAFTGGGISGINLQIGESTDHDRYVLPWDAFNTSTVEDIYSVFDVPSFSGASSVRVYASATGANLDSLAAGALDVYVLRGALE